MVRSAALGFERLFGLVICESRVTADLVRLVVVERLLCTALLLEVEVRDWTALLRLRSLPEVLGWVRVVVVRERVTEVLGWVRTVVLRERAAVDDEVLGWVRAVVVRERFTVAEDLLLLEAVLERTALLRLLAVLLWVEGVVFLLLELCTLPEEERERVLVALLRLLAAG